MRNLKITNVFDEAWTLLDMYLGVINDERVAPSKCHELNMRNLNVTKFRRDTHRSRRPLGNCQDGRVVLFLIHLFVIVWMCVCVCERERVCVGEWERGERVCACTCGCVDWFYAFWCIWESVCVYKKERIKWCNRPGRSVLQCVTVCGSVWQCVAV